MSSPGRGVSDPLQDVQSPIHAQSPLPQRKSARSKAKSFGGAHTIHGLSVPLEKETGSRRKSAITRSILSGQEDEDEAKKRKDARRKSLANRRVSFAPEATLHTWDVIEYLRDGNTTTSSSSSSSSSSTNNAAASTNQRSSTTSPRRSTRRPSRVTGETSAYGDESQVHTPDKDAAVKRTEKQEQRTRRASGIPEPDLVHSSSPLSDRSSPVSSTGGESISDSESDIGSPSDQTDTAMSIDVDESTIQSMRSNDTADDSTGASARLDEALRQAARQAGTQALKYDENGEMSMEMASDEITNAFKPWLQQLNNEQNAEDYPDKENVDPFSGPPGAETLKWQGHNKRASLGSVVDDVDQSMDQSMDISMDITRAVGGIMSASGINQYDKSSETNLDSDTMDLTKIIPGSGIIGLFDGNQADRRASLKRRRSSSGTTTTASELGSPAKKPATDRRTSLRTARRRSSLAPAREIVAKDDTMEIAANLSTIHEDVNQQLSAGDITTSLSDQKSALTGKEDAETGEVSLNDLTMNAAMDMTVMVGGILNPIPSQSELGDKDEDLSMEMTMALGRIQASQKGEERSAGASGGLHDVHKQDWSFDPASNAVQRTPERTSSANHGERDAVVIEVTPNRTPNRASRRASAVPATPETAMPATPVADSIKRTPIRSVKTPTPRSNRRTTPRRSKTNQSSVLPTTNSDAAQTPQSSRSVKQRDAAIVSEVTPPSNLPPPVRSPLAPKNDGAMNRMSSQPTLSDSIKQLATPRKLMSASPLKKIIEATTPRLARTAPKSPVSAKRRTQVKIASPAKPSRNIETREAADGEQEGDDVPKIALREFLGMTGIQFMDLTTTKRRHTGFATLSKAALAQEEDDAVEGDGLDDLERSVVAATTLLPELTMYQHSCHEMKAYLSTGKDVVREIEAGVLEEQPPLFGEYANAPPKERVIMDDQFRAMKTKARLESKGTWYQWRSQLLRDLAGALKQTESGMHEDDKVISGLEADMEQSLTSLNATADTLKAEVASLEQRKAERESGEREQLNDARRAIAQLDADMLAKRRSLEEMQQALLEKEGAIEVASERKEECIAAIREAERVTEECRGWSSEDVAAQRVRARRLKATNYWSVVSATRNPMTMTLAYRDNVELFFHPLAFRDARSHNSSPSKAAHGNAPISLTRGVDDNSNKDHAGDDAGTVQRFFLQLLRAHLLSLPQASTPITGVLSCVSQGWEKCRALLEAVRRLQMLGQTSVDIVGDEQIRIGTTILLPQVETKVKVTFDINVRVTQDSESGEMLDVPFVVKATVVYGEKYDEPKMSEFLKTYCGNSVGTLESAGGWADAVDDLKQRLIKRGRKN